jgi:thiol-disulfide isomerase/thioredoxin
MKFLQLNNEGDVSELNNSVKANKQVFLLIYMEGCGPCNETLPEWKKIENVLNEKTNGNKYNNVVVAEIEQTNLDKLTFIKNNVKGFPSMKYISNNGLMQEDFEDSNIKNKTRTIDAFMEWIDSKLKAAKGQKGGKWSRKYKRSINCRRPRGFSQKNYCKYGRKTNKKRATYKYK